MTLAPTVVRSIRVRQLRPGDSGHLLRGVGFAWDCTCDTRSPRYATYAEARAGHREHVARCHHEPEAA